MARTSGRGGHQSILEGNSRMKTLVVYYSRSGHTAQLAKEIAARCKADLERIRDDGIDRSGLWGYLRSGWQAAGGATPDIRRTARNPADYDLVIIGTPVWNWSLAAPVRTYVRQHAGKFRQVAFFCTEGGSGDRRVFDELQRLCGRPPCATMVVKERELAPVAHGQPLRRFVSELTV
jgi:flavodoxin